MEPSAGRNQEWRGAAVSALLEHGVVDAHHHMVGRSQRKERDPGLLKWLEESYLCCFTLPASGVAAEEWKAQGLTDEQKIPSLLRFLRLARMTTYYQIVKQGLLTCFGFDIDNINESNWHELDEQIRHANNRQDWFEEVLGRRMAMKSGVLDKQVAGTDPDSSGHSDWYEYILKVRPNRDNREVNSKTVVRQSDGQISKNAVKVDALFYGYLKCAGDELRQLFGGEPENVHGLDEYLKYVDEALGRIKSDSTNVALKVALAGVRSLEFPVTAKSKAEKVFTSDLDKLTAENAVDFENFLMHYICGKAAEHGLPIQWHVATGPGGYNTYRNCSAGLLTDLIIRHPETKFDLMHGGFPNYGECGSLASRFSNVYLNLAWMTMISDAGARQVLDDWLDYVPANKIMWSGDCTYVEETIGTYLVSRDQVIDVLGGKIARGQIGREDALFYLRGIFRDNATELFGL